jgi:hypothetical protein
LWEFPENDVVVFLCTRPKNSLVLQADQTTTTNLVRCKKRALLIINLFIGDALVAQSQM